MCPQYRADAVPAENSRRGVVVQPAPAGSDNGQGQLDRGVLEADRLGLDDALLQPPDLRERVAALAADLGPLQDMGRVGPGGVQVCTDRLDSRHGSSACL